MCAAVVLGLSIVTPAAAGGGNQYLSVNKAQLNSMLRAKPDLPKIKRLSGRVPRGQKDTIPVSHSLEDAIKFIQDCNAAGGGLSQEPHPNGVDSVMVCDVN